MIIASIVIGGLAAITFASPIEPPSYPPTLTSKGFRLVINVTDVTKDFSPSINGREIHSLHQQSSFSRATAGAGPGEGNIFYQYPHVDPNNRFAEFQSVLLTELGPNTAGLQIANTSSPDAVKAGMTMNFGSGTMGVMLAVGGYYAWVHPFEYSGVPESFVVCNETIDWISRDESEKFLALDYLRYSWNDDHTEFALHVPQGCAPVNLLAQCDSLPDVPNDSPAVPFHKLAQDVRCYENIAAIDWSKYKFSM
jgi:hypothetical protein